MKTFGEQTLTFVSITEDGTNLDDLGKPTSVRTTTDVRDCHWRPLPATEKISDTGDCPPVAAAVNAKAAAEIVVDGLTYQIVGGPRVFRDRAGTPFKVTVIAQRVTGYEREPPPVKYRGRLLWPGQELGMRSMLATALVGVAYTRSPWKLSNITNEPSSLKTSASISVDSSFIHVSLYFAIGHAPTCGRMPLLIESASSGALVMPARSSRVVTCTAGRPLPAS